MRKNSLYIISSLFFACVLFIYATSTNFQNNNTARQVKSETYTNTITNVPIDIHYDDDQYFISGFASEVSVVLTGANRVTLASEMQESTRKFKVTADLTDASVGTIEVPLNIENLPSGLTAVATPQKITVKVGKKVKRDGMIVVPQVDQSQIDPKLQLDSVTVSNERVSVTTDQETLAKIALLPTSERITGNYSGSVPLQAIDRNGVVLPAVITPFDTTMKVTTKPVAPSSSTSNSTTSSSSETSSSTKATSSKTN